METDRQTSVERLNYTGKLDPVIDRLCFAYQVGKAIDFSVIETGYEDCNVAVTTTSGKYVAKIFSKVRSSQDITRYCTIMEKIVEAGVSHPPLIKTRDNELLHINNQANGISMVLMQFIHGKSFLELNSSPNLAELQAVLKQAAKIDNINYKPTYLSDSWAIPNIHKMLERVQQFIQPDDLKLVEQVLVQYDAIPIKSLPHTFVHGDLTKANVFKCTDKKIYIIDFSVANWYPRIQELAVITANLLYEENNPVHLRDQCKFVADQYSKINPLTSEEQHYLFTYTLASVAMEFMGSHQEKYINGNYTEETEYWLSLGRNGLRKALI